MSAMQKLRPLITVLGSTGTGKSQLAVDLALALNGEIINGDAMQMYKGLDVITNKHPVAERKGVPHHLMDYVDIKDEVRVTQWTTAASEKIDEIRNRDRVPILVGGTHYYVQSLLWDDVLVHADVMEQKNNAVDFPILDGPTADMLAELKRLDPIMGDRWHPNDRRKIRRSLEICLTTNLKVSDLYDEQHRARLDEKGAPSARFRNLLFWVNAQENVLKARLDGRVDDMIERGLLREVDEMQCVFADSQEQGEEIDITRGVWQSIGWKEFAAYYKTKVETQGQGVQPDLVSQLEKLKAESIEKVKVANRQYAKTQIRWIRVKILNRLLLEKNGLPGGGMYLLDSTEPTKWRENVRDPAVEIANRFLERSKEFSLPEPVSISKLAAELLTPLKKDMSTNRDLWIKRTCEFCHTVSVDERTWNIHVNGRVHRRMLRKQEKLKKNPYYRRSRSPESVKLVMSNREISDEFPIDMLS